LSGYSAPTNSASRLKGVPGIIYFDGDMSEKGKQVALSWIEENEKRIIEVSDTIWSYAELGLMEHKSSKLLADELERHGFRVERGVAGSWANTTPSPGCRRSRCRIRSR